MLLNCKLLLLLVLIKLRLNFLNKILFFDKKQNVCSLYGNVVL